MEFSTQKSHDTRKFFLFLPVVLLLICVLPTIARAGNGTFHNGQFDFCVSVRFNATAAELLQIRTAFQKGSEVLADATDGQHRFGTIHIVNNSGASEAAEFWVYRNADRARAPVGQYGVRGQHAEMYFETYFKGSLVNNSGAFTIAHEHAHLAYGVLDEYKGPAGNAECKAPGDAPTDNFCLMDNYHTRGGTYTLNEFCIGAGHDPDADTDQQSVNGKSCWAQIGSLPRRGATAPGGLPVDAAPAGHVVDFHEGGAGLRVVFVLDRSGSMAGERIDFARRAANLFVEFLRDGDSVAVVSFADSGSTNFALTEVSGGGTKSAAKAAINSLSANGSTNIGGGLQTGLNQLTSQATESCNSIIVLLSDGDHNTGPTPVSVIPALQNAGVTVLSVGLGSGISSSGQATLQNVANQTGGRYFSVTSGFSLVGLFLRLTYESFGHGLLVRAPLPIVTGQTQEVLAMVEAGTASATFAVAVANQSDQITLSVRTPSGQIITEAAAANNPDLELIITPNSRALRVRTPEPGNWRIMVTAGTVSQTGAIEIQAFGDHDGVQLNLSVAKDTLTAPEAVQLLATPRFEGEAVTGATLTGTVNRPDGSSVFIALYDDGLIDHSDAIANDGDYSARFNQYSGNGTYTFSIKATVTRGVTASGEELFASFASSSANAVPPFIREATTTAVVTGASTSTAAADLVLTKTASPSNAVPGTIVTYTIDVSNNGPAAATSVTVSDALPASTSFLSCSATNGGVCQGAGNNRQIIVSSLASGASFSITLQATVNSDAADSDIVNTATVGSSVADTAPANNAASATVLLPAARAFQFSASRFSAGESDEVVSITITRTGDASTTATIDYTTADGTAAQRSDYTFASGRLSFAAGQTSQTINLLLNDDAFFEGAETVDLLLSNPTGGFGLGSSSSAQLTIQDNEIGQAGINPIADSRFFSRQHYHDFLHRQSDPSGLDFWTNNIESCGPNVGCREVKRIDTSAAFFLSGEFQQTGFFVIRLQRAAFGHKSESAPSRFPYHQFLKDARQVGNEVIMGQSGSELTLEANRQTYAEQVVSSGEFIARYPASQTAEQFVDALFASAEVTPTVAERQAAVAAYAGGGTTGRAAALTSVTDSASMVTAELNPSFVLMQYYGYLRRNPTDAPDGNDNGYQFWLRKLNQFNGDFRNSEMVKAFIISGEYRSRFGL